MQSFAATSPVGASAHRDFPERNHHHENDHTPQIRGRWRRSGRHTRRPGTLIANPASADYGPEPALPRITCSVILARVIASFRDKGTEGLFDGRDTKQARKACPSGLVRVARRKLDQLNQAAVLGDLRAPPSNRLGKLRGERGGQYSIRINDQWRVCFRRADSGAEEVEIVDYH